MDEKYMKEALKEAKKSLLSDDVPVGAVIVLNNKIISRGHNMKEKNNDPTQHAEIIAIKKATKKLNDWYLNDCIMYVTMEPCLMCAGALIQSHIKKLVYGIKNDKFGYVDSIDNILNNKQNNHIVEIKGNILANESRILIQNFFKTKR
ncbi:MAG: tRNA adenosine(34) deaminase TadA [Bacilli bacterium]|nr:tRNA adenosine(34) deaminase TadA [Bacilli bacterium]